MIPVLEGAPPMAAAIDVLRKSLLDGLDPEAGPPRSVVPVPHGQLLLMPAHWGNYTGVKMVTAAPGNAARGLPRIQGNYLLLDGETLTPLALLDGIALTSVRTAAVSAVAADALAGPDASRLVLFGTGPQARSHLEALSCIRPIQDVVVVGRNADRARAFAAEVGARAGTVDDIVHADIVACCTTARTPLFDGALLPPSATIVAVGSHEPDAREVDETAVARSTVIVEAVSAALREAGDVVQAVQAGALDPGELVGLADVVSGRHEIPPERPRFFKSVGMAWEDLVLAAAHFEAAGI
ncbi:MULTISPECIES: ornithine cyclodeaminase family protein [Streptomyces]|uniref:Ornithine cyclodeaminase family protein n=3 Tax=Streptomyces TaxID=1883 RepID=A0ABD5JFZ6_9ACTN|nr:MULTISPECIES: ornithine cyclodeaminase [Streptomyces]MEE4587336.1 ornithine cyclodeaminase family protein [Streptomyces sp. DSM 41602]RSS45695.1 ornithine cyclodeaminase family protein [Streptomyces sp. WAC05858]WTA86494.1 ornithine cyclodeaminase family protein [Streptomyces antimycoticus]